MAPHGFNVWEQNELCKGRDKEDKKDITNCNGIDAAQQCKMRFMTLEASESVQYSNSYLRYNSIFCSLFSKIIIFLFVLLDCCATDMARTTSMVPIGIPRAPSTCCVARLFLGCTRWPCWMLCTRWSQPSSLRSVFFKLKSLLIASRRRCIYIFYFYFVY